MTDVARLWDAVARAMRLDEVDPVEAWRRHVEKLAHEGSIAQRPRLRPHPLPRTRHRRHHRARRRSPLGAAAPSLNEDGRGVRAQHAHRGGLHLAGLAAGRRHGPHHRALLPRARWAPSSRASSSSCGTGRSPGLEAARGEAEVQQQFDLIPRSRHLGEVAIVDSDSRVATTGLVYKDMLYDENVGSHIAWGFGFPSPSRAPWSSRARSGSRAASTRPNTHVDVVVGSPEVQIDGIQRDETVVPVTRGDEFVLRS